MLYALLSLWALKSIGSLCRTTSYWQVKEYRWDRMKDFFLYQGGLSAFFTFTDLLVLLSMIGGFLIWLVSPEHPSFVEWFPVVIAVLLFSEVLELFHSILKRQFRRPKPTFKALLILAASFALEILAVGCYVLFAHPSIALVDLALVLGLLVVVEHDINGFVVFVLNRFTNLLKRRLYRKAADKRSSFKNLKVVGITGSYGKTSVKDFLSHILEGQFKVLKTPLNTNTEIGIAQTIVRDLTEEHEVFVCEMGAYRIGEIRLCCLMAQPEVAIFTGLNEQHISLFGSLDNTFSAKWELPSSISPSGLFIANADADELRTRIVPLRCETSLCRVQGEESLISDLEVSAQSFQFRYQDHVFTAPLVGGFHAINVLMAIVAAERLGMSLEAIAQRVQSLSSPPKTLEVSTYGNVTICDDSYNVNTDGLRAAVDHLACFEDHTKVLFFPGIMELGEKTDQIHKELAEYLSYQVDHAFFIDPVQSDVLTQGALQGALTRSHIHTSPDTEEQIEALQSIIQSSSKPVVVLFESRGAEAVMDWIKERKLDQ